MVADAAKHEQDLRKGVLMLAVLSQLRTPQYGYSLRQALAERGMPIEEGTLYPLLRRLEGQGILASQWQAGDGPPARLPPQWQADDGPPRRYYRLSAAGAALYQDLTTAWGSLTSVMDALLNEEN